MSMSYAMLLDGGFLRRKLGTPKQPVDAAGISSFASKVSKLKCLDGMRLHRIYFYDSRPLEVSEKKPLDGELMNFGASEAAARNKSLQASLAKEPFFAMRFGELHLEGWRLKTKVLKKTGPSIEIDADDLDPNIGQKAWTCGLGSTSPA